jgi:hypothetical protein
MKGELMIGTINMSGALRNLTESIRTLMANAQDFALRHWRVIGLLALLAVVALAGYAAWPRTTPASTAMTASTPGWSRQCVAGVSYLQFASGVSVEWTPAGKVKTCSDPAR